MSRRLPSLALAGALIVAGCSATVPPARPPATGGASWRQVAPAGMQHYSLAMGQVASGAALLRRVTPVYPTELVARCPPPVEIQALLIVDTQGVVSEVRVPAPGGAGEGGAVDPLFAAAVRTAAMQWTFFPLHTERWAADAEGHSHRVDSQTLPFSMAYVFRFECHQGKGSVSHTAAPSSPPPRGG